MSKNKTAEEKKKEQAKAAEKPKEAPLKSEPHPETGPEMVRVRVKKEIVKNGGGFHDFHSGMDMYPKSDRKIFKVPLTPFIQQKIRTGELLLVLDKEHTEK